MSVLFAGGTNGSPADVTAYNANWDLLEGSLADRGNYLISGLAVTAVAGLAVNVALGVASIGGRVTVAGSFAIAGLTPSTTNDLYLLQNGTGTALVHPSTQPALSAKLGTCVTGVATVTSVSQTRSSGCQQQVRTENLVPGGPGGGQPASINLAGWAAAAADGVTVYGTLPAGSLPADVAYIDAGNTFTVTQIVTPSVTSRCLTLNHKNATGATVFLTSNNAVDSTWRTLINFGSKFQFGTDSTFSGTADWFVQNQTTGNIVLQASAADLLTLGSATGGAAVPGALAASGLITQTVTDAATSVETSMVTLTHKASGTPAAGFGTAIEFDGDDSSHVNRRMGKCSANWLVATSGATVSQIELYAASGGSFVPCLIADGTQLVTVPGSFAHTGVAGTNKIGFFAATPVIQQANASQAAITAVTDANARNALQALYNLIHAYGLAPATA